MTHSVSLTAVPTADRVLQVLAVLAQQGKALSAAELMAHTGLARSTLYRQLARLKRWGFVLESDGYYAPGPLGLQLALGFDLASHLVRQARPAMVELAQQSQESVGLVVAVNDRAICLDMVESQQSLRCSFEKGRSVPLRAGASAKCLLAHLPEAARAGVLDAQWGKGWEKRFTHFSYTPWRRPRSGRCTGPRPRTGATWPSRSSTPAWWRASTAMWTTSPRCSACPA